MRRPAIAVLATVVMLAGCTPRSPSRPVAAPRGSDGTALPAAGEIFDALAQRRAAVRGVRALARLSYTSPQETRKAKQLVIAERPDRLRFEILSPFGTVFVLAAAGGALAAWARDESIVYRGSASAENLQRYAQVDLPVTTAVDLLLGTPQLHDGLDSVVSADGGAIELWQDAGRTVDVLWLTPALEPVRYERRAPDGRVLLRATFAEYTASGSARVPTQLAIELPPAQRRLDIALSDTEVNPPLADSVFALETPAGSRDVDLDSAR